MTARYAFDADGLSPNPLWYASFINPGQGITAGPMLFADQDLQYLSDDRDHRNASHRHYDGHVIYFDTHIDNNGVFSHYLHALDITTGAEKFGAPILVSASVKGKVELDSRAVIFLSTHNTPRSAPGLLLMNGVVYVPYGNYHGCSH